MYHPSDDEYPSAKHRKITGEPLAPPFRELAAWMASRYNVTVLDITHSLIDRANRPRLDIILEYGRDLELFRPNRFDYDADKVADILAQFRLLTEEHSGGGLRTDGLFLTLSSFDWAARIEANENITERELEELKARLSNPALWMISRLFDSITFFFHTDAQAADHRDRGLLAVYAEEYAKLAARHDEFGYLARDPVRLNFDSKQTLDTKYGGVLHSYYM